jgi:regulator of sigma E protease
MLGVPAGSPAAEAGLKTFDRILSINGVAIPDEAALNEQLAKMEGPLELTIQRLEPVAAGVVAGHAPTVKTVTVRKQPDAEGFAALGAEASDTYVGIVFPGSPAEKAGLRVGDRLVSLNDGRLNSFNVLSGKLSTLKDQTFKLSWLSADGRERTEVLAQASRTSKDTMGNESTRLELGLRPWMPSSAELLPPDKVTVTLGVGEALREAATVVPKIVGQMVKVIGGLVTGQVSHKTLGGPVMMYQLASQSAERGLDDFLHLMAIIAAAPFRCGCARWPTWWASSC